MDFRLSFGPWRQLLKGVFQDIEMELLSNQESMLLALLFDKQDGKTVGVIAELYSVFAVTGALEAFAETLHRGCLTITRHDAESSSKFLLLSSSPAYIEYSEEKIAAAFDELYKKTLSFSKTVREISRAYSIRLQEIEQASEEERSALFSQPLLGQIAATAAAPGARAAVPAEAVEAGGKVGELLLGITKTGNPVKEPLVLFKKTIVVGGNSAERLHSIHLLVEGCLASGFPAMLLDLHNWFNGIAEQSKNLAELQRFGVGLEPIGFPVKSFLLGQNACVDLDSADASALLEFFGAGKGPAAAIISETIAQNKGKVIAELRLLVEAKSPAGEASAYQIRKASRILSLLEMAYPNLFAGKNDFSDIARPWGKGIGRASIFPLEGKELAAKTMLAHSLVRGLLEHFKQKGVASELRAMLFLPEAKEILELHLEDKIVQLIAEDLAELPAYGVGVVVSSEKSLDLKNEIAKSLITEIGIVEGNDVGVKVEGKKPYRVFLRPGLSACTEIKR